MANLPREIYSQNTSICILYMSLKLKELAFNSLHMFRYQAVLMRDRFDKNKDVKDLRLAQQILDDGEKELFSYMHYQPRKFPLSPGGVAYEREVQAPDWVVDYWHPMEKAAYPDYFARREQRKQEYIEWWEKTYGKPQAEAH
ncbi:unnamed protein product, partial [Meganyctiphanes norvegica]